MSFRAWDGTHTLFTQTCTIRRIAGATDANGYGHAGSATDTAGVPCRLQASGSSETQEFGLERGNSGHTLYCPTNTAAGLVKATDRIVLGSRLFEALGPGVERGEGTKIQAVPLREMGT